MNKRGDKRIFYLVLPLLVLPFCALAFWALGGGSGVAEQAAASAFGGINKKLPDARFESGAPKSKLDYYERARVDSLKRAKAHRAERRSAALPLDEGLTPGAQEASVVEIHRKLKAIEQEIERPVEVPAAYPLSTMPDTPALAQRPAGGMKADIDRLERLIQVMQRPDTARDVEMEQLSAMLEKILDIQHPGRVTERLEERREEVQADRKFRAIPAMIAGRQKVQDGEVVVLELRDSVWLNGVLIPRGHRVFGACRVANRRLLVEVENIRMGRLIIPVDLTVYSLDGLPGIAAEKAEVSGAARTGAARAASSIDLLGYDPSIASRVASVGIDAAKDLVRRKAKRVKITLDGGTLVLLRNNKQ